MCPRDNTGDAVSGTRFPRLDTYLSRYLLFSATRLYAYAPYYALNTW